MLSAAEGRALLAAQPKPSKYRAKPQLVDGIRFASKREAGRYAELMLLQRSGKICGLIMQEPFEITVNDVVCFKWLADFSYFDKETGARVVEDVKSKPTMTPVYRLKKKIVEATFGFRIIEVLT